MGEVSAIEWTDATWNPWQGCTKVSPACEHCYMFTDMKRYGRDGSIVVQSKPSTFNLPLKHRRTGEFAIPPGFKVFTCSWSDWFHKTADPWRDRAWAIVRQRPDVTFQIVTKRTERIGDCLPDDWGKGYPNVWLIATVENQKYADIRIPQVLSVPAAVHGLSMEPLLGAVDVSQYLVSKKGFFANVNSLMASGKEYFKKPGIDWVIVGGESGAGSRPMHPQWVRSLRYQCYNKAVPFFFKQWGDWLPWTESGLRSTEARRINDNGTDITDAPELWCSDEHVTDAYVYRVGKKAAGRNLDGRTWDEFPVQNA